MLLSYVTGRTATLIIEFLFIAATVTNNIEGSNSMLHNSPTRSMSRRNSTMLRTSMLLS